MPIYVEISKSVNSTETEEDLENDFKNNKHDSHWKRFETVSQRLFNLIGENNGVGATDVVKCFQNHFQKRFQS
jgi:hypothetical protein